MFDGTVQRAARTGTRTARVERGRPKQLRGDIRIDADELALALDMARADRLEQQLRDYAYRKRQQ